MIEKDIKAIRKTQTASRTKTAQELKTIGKRLSRHDKQFQALNLAIGELPTQDVITKTIQDTIKVVVNGKIDLLNNKVDMVGEHLKKQDEVAEEHGNAIQDLSNQIGSYTKAKTWLAGLGKVVVYLGYIATAIAAIIGLYYLFHHAH